MIISIVFILFFVGFLLHLMWWRFEKPVHTSRALFLIFSLVLILILPFILLFTRSNELCSLPNTARLVLLYILCVLEYIILYSAVEQQSPTLSIINHLHELGDKGCDQASLIKHLNPNNHIIKRLHSMEETNLIINQNGYLTLTKKGRKIAYLFEYAAILFGVQKGG